MMTDDNITDNRHVSVVLSKFKDAKEEIAFNPALAAHRLAYVKFVATGKWDFRFKAEWPHVSVPETVRTKLCERACKEEVTKFEADKLASASALATAVKRSRALVLYQHGLGFPYA